MLSLSTKPAADEYAPYYSRYIDLVPVGSIVNVLQQQMADTLSFLASISEDQANSRYAPEKWSLKEVAGHIVDCERIFAYRALRFARNDKTALAGFEQDDYVSNGNFELRQLSKITKEYEHVRAASIDLFDSLNEEAWDRRGKANEVEISVRALAWIICGHELHHKTVIRERYI